MWKNLLVNLFVGIMLVQSSLPPAVSQPDLKQSDSPASGDNPATTSSAVIKVSIRAAGKPPIAFKTQNGRRVEQNLPENRTLPHLVLKRNGVLTPGYERTLHITLSDLAIPDSAATVILYIETQHGDPDQGSGEENRIAVWKDAIEFAEAENASFLKFAVRLDEHTEFQGKTIPTPTDYFRTRLTFLDVEGKQLAETITDYAFLMENQWQVPLPELTEETPGAAPNRLAVYFCDMFPFVINPLSPEGRLQRAEVERYIQVEFIPEMVEAIRTQTNVWEFPWYAEWVNHRNGEDPKILSVALTNGDTWYHGPAPTKGHAEISIRVDGSMMEYTTLTDGIMSTFHHELFHNLQRNISLHFGGHADIDGAEDTWETVSEGTAVLASSVGQPVVQFERSLGWRSYINRAKGFIGDEGATGGDLNQSYEKITYHSAIYWRYLYEQCGGMRFGIEDPTAGMEVIRTTLKTLYEAKVAGVRGDPNVVEELPRLMDRVFEKQRSCPFVNYADSLEHFARAIYSLKLEDGRCVQPGIPRGCGFYDPKGLYPLPSVQTVNLTSGHKTINGEIPGSYGIDFIDIMVGLNKTGQSLSVELASSPGSKAKYSAQVVKIMVLDDDPQQPGYLVQYGHWATLMEQPGSRTLVYAIDRSNLEHIDSIGLVITRLDGNEKSESGGYEVTVRVQ